MRDAEFIESSCGFAHDLQVGVTAHDDRNEWLAHDWLRSNPAKVINPHRHLSEAKDLLFTEAAKSRSFASLRMTSQWDATSSSVPAPRYLCDSGRPRSRPSRKPHKRAARPFPTPQLVPSPPARVRRH